MPEDAQQIRPFALGDDGQSEPLDVEIERDEIVDLLHLARCELGADLGVALPSGNDLTPGLGWEGVIVERWTIPAATLGYVVDACGYVGWKIKGGVTLTPALFHDGRGREESRRVGFSASRAFHVMPWPTAG